MQNASVAANNKVPKIVLDRGIGSLFLLAITCRALTLATKEAVKSNVVGTFAQCFYCFTLR